MRPVCFRQYLDWNRTETLHTTRNSAPFLSTTFSRRTNPPLGICCMSTPHIYSTRQLHKMRFQLFAARISVEVKVVIRFCGKFLYNVVISWVRFVGKSFRHNLSEWDYWIWGLDGWRGCWSWRGIHNSICCSALKVTRCPGDENDIPVEWRIQAGFPLTNLLKASEL